jgi:hypothetical protein
VIESKGSRNRKWRFAGKDNSTMMCEKGRLFLCDVANFSKVTMPSLKKGTVSFAAASIACFERAQDKSRREPHLTSS